MSLLAKFFRVMVVCGLGHTTVVAQGPETRFMPPAPRFSLGVQGQVTETGVVVQSVAAGSVGQAVGIERGDTIINVDGQQVGKVENRVVDLDETLGRVLRPGRSAILLLRNGRDGRLLNVRVQELTKPPTRPPGAGMTAANGQIRKWYLQYLSREPRTAEMQTWDQHLKMGKSLGSIQDIILASPEYYGLQANDETKFIGGLFRDVLRRQPVHPEGSNWLTRLKQLKGDRLKLAESFRVTYQPMIP